LKEHGWHRKCFKPAQADHLLGKARPPASGQAVASHQPSRIPGYWPAYFQVSMERRRGAVINATTYEFIAAFFEI
jgi:hypothetical protein